MTDSKALLDFACKDECPLFQLINFCSELLKSLFISGINFGTFEMDLDLAHILITKG